MVRLVFRPYTQIWRSICTSEPLRASIRVSSDFTLFRHSSPSFGSQQIRSYSDLSKESRPVDGAPEGSHLHLLSFRARVCHPNTCVCVGLLGPCFKTGRLKPFRQHPKFRVVLHRASSDSILINKLSKTGQSKAAYSPKQNCNPRSSSRHDARL